MKFLCGYNMNLDAVYSINGDDIAELLEQVDEKTLLESIKDTSANISSLSDLIAGLVGCMREGTGAEWFIQDISVFRYLMEHFYDRSIIRIGGNMAIMANVMSEMGADEVVLNPVGNVESIKPLMSDKAIIYPKVSDMEAADGVDMADGRNGVVSGLTDNIVTKTDVNTTEDIVHFVFDFKKGTTFEVFGEYFTVARENRFIATYDNVNTELYISPAFENYSLEYVWGANGAIVSGFNQLRLSYPDGSDPIEKFENAQSLLKKWKYLNPSLLIHAELGHFSSSEMAEFIFLELSDVVDVIGLNEDEIGMLSGLHGVPKSQSQDIDAYSIVEACTRCLHTTNLKKMVVHTRDLIVSVFRDDISKCENEIQSLEFGIECAGYFAAKGKLPQRLNIVTMASELSRSVHGLEQIKHVQNFIPSIIGIGCDAGACGEYSGLNVCIVPTLLCDDPISTVGLGDTVMAASFLRWVELMNS